MLNNTTMQRPRSATILGILVLGQGLIFIVVASLTLALLSPAVRETLAPLVGFALPTIRLSRILLAVAHLFLGIIGLVSGVSILQLRSWAWLMAMIAQGINLAAELYNYNQGQAQYVSMIFSVFIVFYLNQRDVQAVFQAVRHRERGS